MLGIVGTRMLNCLIGLDIAAGGLIGCDRYMTMSGTIGKSIKAGGFWARVWLPGWFRAHCLGSDYTAEV